MAEKFSVLIKYKYLEFMENAHLSDADSWQFLKGIIEYDKTGISPAYINPVLMGLFAAVKNDLDQNRESWEAIIEERSKSGKKGAEKRWGKKDDGKNSKCHKNIGKMANAKLAMKKMANIADLDLDHEYGPEFENLNVQNGVSNETPQSMKDAVSL